MERTAPVLSAPLILLGIESVQSHTLELQIRTRCFRMHEFTVRLWPSKVSFSCSFSVLCRFLEKYVRACGLLLGIDVDSCRCV